MTRQRLVGYGLALLTFFVVLANQREVGIARDEVVYFNAGSRYAEWWDRAFTGKGVVSKKGITDYWGGIGGGNNAEHPPLAKTLIGASHKLFHDKLHILDELTAFRLPGALFAALVVWLVFSMTLAIWGFAEAGLAAACMLLMPRALFHEGLACFDAPIMAMWFLTIYWYWRCLDGRRFPVEVGAAFGLALATKHNAILLPFALGLHYVIIGAVAGGLRGAFLHRWRVIVSMLILGPVVLFYLWPWLWIAPIKHTKEWLSFHLTHVHYNFEYLGHNWNAPRFPWHVALVTTLFTVPIGTLAGALTGIGVWIGRWRTKTSADRERAPALLLGLSAAASMGPFFLGTTPIFGAEKHWMPALPTLCIAAGVGGIWAARQAARYLETFRSIGEATARKAALSLVAGTMILAAATETIDAQPYGLTWYNSLAGGAPGGADRGMNRQFWGVSAKGVLPFLQWMPPGPVYSHDASPAWGWYMRLGMLSRGYPDAGHEYDGIQRSQYALVIHEKHFNRHDYLIWKSYGTVQPVFVLRSDGVPIVSVYKRPPKAP
ncbi:MAG TPA: glycosyltransferase family 39 protein [Kofleriaceae bacterium]|nr:glycosyltransferase family 39 protein [Kofleriaceae bacterium]